MLYLPVFLFALLLAAASGNVAFTDERFLEEIVEDERELKGKKMFPSVKEIDLEAYSGDWFLAYAGSKATDSYLKDLKCIKAQYEPGKKSLFGIFKEVPIIKLRNAGIGKKGVVKSGEGAAWQFFPKYPGAFVLTMKPQPGQSPIPPGSYRVLLLGDINDNGQYEWAVVQGGKSLFVLVRDIEFFRDNLEPTLLSILEEKDLDPEDLVEVYQEDNCEYDRLFPDEEESSSIRLRGGLDLEAFYA
jgi:lipocalin